MGDVRKDLVAATRRYRQTEAAHDAARRAVIAAVVAALQAGVSPTEVQRLGPFTGAYVRRVARDSGIPPSPPGPKPARR